MKVNTGELTLLLQEASELSSKQNWSKSDERRNAYLLAAISAVKNGVSLTELDQTEHQAREQRAGLPVTQFRGSFLTPERRSIAREWKNFVEQRDMVGGNPISRVGSYSGLGYFVPTEFYPNLFAAMKKSDPVLSSDDVSLIQTTNGRVVAVPTLGDISNVAQVISEGSQDSSVDLANVGAAAVGAYSYRTPRFTCSIESFQDVESAGGVASMFEAFAADRLSRGISADMVNGNGSGKTLGLVPSVVALASTATPIITAIGAGASSGLTSVGIGPEDISALYFSVDEAYRSSPKAAWLVNDTTLQQLCAVITKEGLPLVSIREGVLTLHGKPVKVSPSMQNVSNGNYPVLFGDLSYWVTRLCVSDDSYIKAITEANGLAENGKIAFRAYMRADGALAFTSASDPAPINLLRCAHS
jgi:HK97 family phage major capsid protein